MGGDRTRVYITVDVECREERVEWGQVSPAMGYDLRIWGRFVNQRDPLGIELILRELEAHGFVATWFVEALGAHHFGYDGLRDVCRLLQDRGQDVQLHVHPVQRLADWYSRDEPRASDDIAEYPFGHQVALLHEGLDLLERAGVPRERLRAYRAGNFGAGNEIWRAMKLAGLCLSSNYNPCYFGKTCRMRHPDARPGLFPTTEEGVWELPITNFVEPKGAYRHLQITSTSLDEMVHCLRRCRALGVREVTIVTHSFEFLFIDAPTLRRGRLNRLNLDRLRGLCRFLHESPDDFEVDTVGALAARLAAGEAAALGPGPPQFPCSTRLQLARRVAEQMVKRVAERVSFA